MYRSHFVQKFSFATMIKIICYSCKATPEKIPSMLYNSTVMTYKNRSPQQKVKDYFNTLESRLGYAFILKGRKHFGYYPKGKENLTMLQAQELMEDKLAEKLQLKSDSLLLDAGCGEGKVAIYVSSQYGR